jgi:hypothetical protein
MGSKYIVRIIPLHKEVTDSNILKSDSDKALLSNRLYRFELSAGSEARGIPFYVDLDNTDSVEIRIFSPTWPTIIRTYAIYPRLR